MAVCRRKIWVCGACLSYLRSVRGRMNWLLKTPRRFWTVVIKSRNRKVMWDEKSSGRV